VFYDVIRRRRLEGLNKAKIGAPELQRSVAFLAFNQPVGFALKWP